MSLPQAEIVSAEPTTTETPERKSFYAITINTNFRPQNAAEQLEVSNTVDAALKEAFRYEYSDMLNWMNGFRPEAINRAKATIRVETGQNPHGMRIHSHVLLQIWHTTRIQLDYYRLKYVVMNKFLAYGLGDKVRGLYVNIKLLKNPADAWEIYQKKKEYMIRQASAAEKRRLQRQLAEARRVHAERQDQNE
jgi:hypothetical protein